MDSIGGNKFSRMLDADVERLKNLPKDDRPSEGFIIGVEYAAHKVYRSDDVIMTREELQNLLTEAVGIGMNEGASYHADYRDTSENLARQYMIESGF